MTEIVNNAYKIPIYLRQNSKIKTEAEEKSLFLEMHLDEINDKQGILGNAWNGVKELTTLGVSKSDCEKMLYKYRSGEITFEEAVEYLDKYDKKQSNATSLISNIVTGIGAIAFATTHAAGASLIAPLAIKLGAPIGALIKTGVNFVDRATNNIEDDAFDIKQIAKDAISGATTGAASAVTSGVGKGIKDKNIWLSIKNGTKCGLACGAASGAIGYTADAALEKDVKFNIKDLAKNTATSAFVSGTVGAAVGAGLYGAATQGIGGSVGQETSKSLGQTIAQDSTTSSLRKVLGQAEKTVLNLG